MIKQGIVNFFKNLKYFFTPLGTIALGLVFGLSIFLPGVIAATGDLARGVQSILSDTTVDFNALKGSLLTAVKALEWSDPLTAIRTMVSEKWLTDTLSSCVGAFVEDTGAYTTAFKTVIGEFTHTLGMQLYAVIAFTALGMIAGYFLTRWLIRRNMAKRTIKTFLLHALVDSVLTVALTGVCAWLTLLWKPSIFLSVLFAVVFFGSVSLLEAYLIHGRKRVPLKEIVNFKNIMKLFATNLIILALSAALVAAVVLIVNAIVGIFVGIAFLEIGFIVIALNAEAYVKTTAENAANTQQKVGSPAEMS